MNAYLPLLLNSALRTCLAGSLTTRQINQMQLTTNNRMRIIWIVRFHCKSQNAMWAWRCVIETMSSQHFISYSNMKQIHDFLSTLAFKSIEILNHEVILLIPS